MKLGTRFWGSSTSLLAGSDSTDPDDAEGRLWLTMVHTMSTSRMASRIRMPASSPFRLSRCSLPCGLCSARTGCIGVSGFCIGFHFLIASDSSLALILSHFSQLLCCFFIGLGKLYKGFTLCLSLGSSCPRVFSLAFCHHSGIFGVCRHAFFLTLLFSLSGYGFFFFQGLPFLGGFRVCLGGFFQLLSGKFLLPVGSFCPFAFRFQ